MDSAELKITVSERDETHLHDIKEEEELDRTCTTSIISQTLGEPATLRPISPREEEVFKIVADVAKVLKSEKAITEIIPDFDEQKLEEKLKTSEDTASNDAIEICTETSKQLTCDIEKPFLDKVPTTEVESEKSSPDLKSSGPVSIEEKDKIEISEKMQLKELKAKETKDETSRRESTISTYSEKDITRDDDTFDDKQDIPFSSLEEKPKVESSTIKEEITATDTTGDKEVESKKKPSDLESAGSSKDEIGLSEKESIVSAAEEKIYTILSEVATKAGEIGDEVTLISLKSDTEKHEQESTEKEHESGASRKESLTSSAEDKFESTIQTPQEVKASLKEISEKTLEFESAHSLKSSKSETDKVETTSVIQEKQAEKIKTTKDSYSLDREESKFESSTTEVKTATMITVKKEKQESQQESSTTSTKIEQDEKQTAVKTKTELTTTQISSKLDEKSSADTTSQVTVTETIITEKPVQIKTIIETSTTASSIEESAKDSLSATSIESKASSSETTKLVSSQIIDSLQEEDSRSESVSSVVKVEEGFQRESLSEKEVLRTLETKDIVDKSELHTQMEESQIISEECSTESLISEIQTSAQSKHEKAETSKMSSTSETSVKESLKQIVEEFLATEKIISTKEIMSTYDAVSKSMIDSPESRRESALSQTSEERQIHSDQEDDDEEDEITAHIKEGRSKSIASIMTTSIYKPSKEVKVCETLGEEIEETSSKQSILEKKTKAAKESLTLAHSYEHELADPKTPPTAPVSPGIIKTTSGTSSSSATSKTIITDTASMTTTHSGPLSPKDISGKSSPGGMTSESQSLPTPMGRESLTETPESSPKPTSPFPRVTKEDLKSTASFSAAELEKTAASFTTSEQKETSSLIKQISGEVLPDLHEIRGIEKTAALSGSTEKIITTTITTVTKVISADGKEIVTEEKTITTTDSTDTEGEKVTVTTTRTTSESDKSDVMLPKEVAMLRSIYRSSTPGSDDGVAYLSDEEVPASPRSITSSHGVSYDLQRSGSGISKKSDFDLDESQDDIPPQYGSEELSAARSITATKDYLNKFSDPMSTSFYGALPDTFETKTSQPINIQGSSDHLHTFKESPISQSSSSTDSAAALPHKFLEEADKGFEQALKEHVELRGADVMSSVTSKYSYSPSKAEEVEQTVTSTEKPKFPLGSVQKKDGATIVTTTTTTVTTTQEGGTSSKTTTTETSTTSSSASVDDKLKEWGKPLGLPSPAPMAAESDVRTTPKKERRLVATKTRLNNEKNLRKRSESPHKAKKPSPVYVDLTYVPHNGNSYYSHVEFFKRVRARYYVFSGTEPSRLVYDALLEAKQTWDDKELEVTIIPTYDTDVLGYWVAENEELLAKYRIDLSPSASRCTINLQDHETSCSAYRLEF